MNYDVTFEEPSGASVIPSVQRWLPETPGTQAETRSLPEVSHLGFWGGGILKGKAICSFPSWEFSPMCLRVDHGGVNNAAARPVAGGRGGARGRPVAA